MSSKIIKITIKKDGFTLKTFEEVIVFVILKQWSIRLISEFRNLTYQTREPDHKSHWI